MQMRLQIAAAAMAASLLPVTAVEAAPAKSSPFLGKWALDVKRMPVTYGTAPKSVTYEFVDIGGGRWETRIHIVDDGGVRDMAVSYRRDGQSNAGSGYKGEGDNAAVNSPAPNVLVMSLAREKQLESVRTYAVSADGREMVESAADVDDQGVPFVRNFYFRKLDR